MHESTEKAVRVREEGRTMNNPKIDINRHLYCEIDDERKSITTTMIYDGNTDKLMEQFHRFIHCLGADYSGYTIFAIVPLYNGNILNLYAKIY